jgi:hypothetical protein
MSNRPFPSDESAQTTETQLVESPNPIASQVVFDAIMKNCVFGKSWQLHEGCVMLNGQNGQSDSVMSTTQDNSTFVRPVRNWSNDRLLMFNKITNEVTQATYVSGNIEIGTTDSDGFGGENLNILRIGSPAGNVGAGSLSHPHWSTPQNFMIAQAESDGTTSINAPALSTLYFCKGGSPRMSLSSSDEFSVQVHQTITGAKFMYVFSGGYWIQRNIGLSVVDAVSANAFLATSDDRLKHNEVSLDTMDCISIVQKLRPKYYQKTTTMLDASHTGPLTIPYTLEAGLIAQDVNQIEELKYCVTRDKDDASKPWAVDYASINMYLLSAVQTLIKRVETLEKKIST